MYMYEAYEASCPKINPFKRLTSDVIWCIMALLNLAIICLVAKEGNLLSDYWSDLVILRRAFLVCIMIFLNLNSLIVYCQVVVFKRVMEINDEMCSSCLRRACYFSSLCFSFAFPLDKGLANRFELEMNGQWSCPDQPVSVR